uniref:NAD(P)-binding domain-containing protein n=1 Tax=Acetobacter fabarum TaxID=483199 RepID=UPI0033AE2A61
FEAKTACHSWDDERWDNFCLVTPNWQCELPGHPYRGSDPHGFMVKKEIIDYVKGFTDSFTAPLREHTPVTSITRHENGGYRVVAGAELWHAQYVVIASGAYHDAVIPGYASAIDPSIY